MSLARVAAERFNLGRTEIARIDLDQDLARLRIEADLVHAAAAPLDRAVHMGERPLDEFAHRVGFARCEHVIVRLGLLKDHPHSARVVLGVTPVTLASRLPR